MSPPGRYTTQDPSGLVKKGTARLQVKVPGPGALVLSGKEGEVGVPGRRQGGIACSRTKSVKLIRKAGRG
jgi:hypothetical protein